MEKRASRVKENGGKPGQGVNQTQKRKSPEQKSGHEIRKRRENHKQTKAAKGGGYPKVRERLPKGLEKAQ